MKAVTGIAADGRKLASEAKAHARTYRRNFGSPIPPKVCLSYFFLYANQRYVIFKGKISQFIPLALPCHFISGSRLTNRKSLARAYVLRRPPSLWQFYSDFWRRPYNQGTRAVHVGSLRDDTGIYWLVRIHVSSTQVHPAVMKRYFGCAIGKGVTAARTGYSRSFPVLNTLR